MKESGIPGIGLDGMAIDQQHALSSAVYLVLTKYTNVLDCLLQRMAIAGNVHYRVRCKWYKATEDICLVTV